MSALTLDGVGTALFGTDLHGSTPQITHALADMLAGFRLAMAPGGVVLLRTPLPAARRVRRAKAELEQVVDDLVRQRTREPAGQPTVLDLLGSQPELTDQQARDQVMTLLLAGHETTAMALTWALAAIDQAPAVRAELENEWDARADEQTIDPRAEALSPATLPSATLPLTTAVLAETLRLWPPSWMFSRRTTEPLTLGGRCVPAGIMCLVSPALLHRDPVGGLSLSSSGLSAGCAVSTGNPTASIRRRPASHAAPSCRSVPDPECVSASSSPGRRPRSCWPSSAEGGGSTSPPHRCAQVHLQ